MKKVILLVLVLLIAFAVSAYAVPVDLKSAQAAYEKFNEAKDIPPLGSVYDAASSEMRDALKKGIKSYRLNRPMVKSAIAFFVGEGDESQAGLKKRSKAAERIADRYFTGDAIKNLNNFQDDSLSKKKMGDLAKYITQDKKTREITIVDDLKAKEYALQLGMSENALSALLGLFQEVDADADFDSLYKP